MSQETAIRYQVFVAGNSPNSCQALHNLRLFCEEHLPDRHQIEVIDVFQEPERAMEESVLLTPLTIKVSPPPILKIIGSLSDRAPLFQTLESSN